MSCGCKSYYSLCHFYLTALVGAIVFWLSNTAADIFFLLSDDSTTTHGSSAPLPQTRAFKSRTYNLSHSPETREIEGGLIEETTFNFTDIPTESEEASSNTTPTVTDIYPATTERYNFSTEHLAKDWISLGPTTVQSPPDDTSGTVPGTNIVTHHTHLPLRSSFTEKGSVPENTTAKMETNKSACIPTSSLTDAEVLALVVGAVFLTIVLSKYIFILIQGYNCYWYLIWMITYLANNLLELAQSHLHYITPPTIPFVSYSTVPNPEKYCPLDHTAAWQNVPTWSFMLSAPSTYSYGASKYELEARYERKENAKTRGLGVWGAYI